MTIPRVLVVDDEPLMAEVFLHVLKPHFEVLVCHSAEEAQAQLASGARYEALIVDIFMPGMTGLDLYDWLKIHTPRLSERVLFTSGGAVTKRARAAMEAHPGRFLHKPFDISALVPAVESIIGGF